MIQCERVQVPCVKSIQYRSAVVLLLPTVHIIVGAYSLFSVGGHLIIGGRRIVPNALELGTRATRTTQTKDAKKIPQFIYQTTQPFANL